MAERVLRPFRFRLARGDLLGGRLQAHRRLCARMDKPKAVTSAAHELARLIYAMLTKGQEYTDQGQADYEERYRERVIANLNRRAQALGLQIVPITPSPTSA